MEFEFVEFYPDISKHSKFLGTAHVYVFSKKDPDVTFDVRGIIILKNYQNKILVQMPQRTQFDPEEKKLVKFTVLELNKDNKKKLQVFVRGEYIKWRKAHPEFKEHCVMQKEEINPNFIDIPEMEVHDKKYAEYRAAHPPKKFVPRTNTYPPKSSSNTYTPRSSNNTYTPRSSSNTYTNPSYTKPIVGHSSTDINYNR